MGFTCKVFHLRTYTVNTILQCNNVLPYHFSTWLKVLILNWPFVYMVEFLNFLFLIDKSDVLLKIIPNALLPLTKFIQSLNVVLACLVFRQTDGQTDRRIDRQTDIQTDRQTDRRTDSCKRKTNLKKVIQKQSYHNCFAKQTIEFKFSVFFFFQDTER